MNKNAFLLVNKPVGITSFGVISKLRKILSIKKIGHAGVLDKSASGLLVCGIGKATRLLSIFENEYKVYEAEITFGLLTNTLDMEGIVLKREPYIINEQAMRDALKNFIGEIEQSVPIYSNVKVNGKKLYQYALSGKEVHLPNRRIFIYSIDIIDMGANTAYLKIKCSKGTYIRSLANDIARSLGTYGTVSKLKRTAIHPFNIKDAVCLDQDEESIKNSTISIYDALSFLPNIVIKDRYITNVANGVPIEKISNFENIINGYYKVLSSDSNVLAVICINNRKATYKLVL